MALDLPDLGNLRSSLSTDLLAMEDEDAQPLAPRRVSRRGVLNLQLPWYLWAYPASRYHDDYRYHCSSYCYHVCYHFR